MHASSFSDLFCLWLFGGHLQANTQDIRHFPQKGTSGLHGQECTPSHQILESPLTTLPFTIRFHDIQMCLSSLVRVLEEYPLLGAADRVKKTNSSP